MSTTLSISSIKQCIHSIRGYSVMLDDDLAGMFDLETRILNRTAQ